MYEIQTYLGADGLMHCTVCKEPVEAVCVRKEGICRRGTIL